MSDQANEKSTKSRASYYLFDRDKQFIESLARTRTGELDRDVSRSDIVTEAIDLLRQKEERKKAGNKTTKTRKGG